MPHGPELAIAVIVCFTLVVGAALRSLARRWGFPYTVALLCVGLAVGLLLPPAGTGSDRGVAAWLAAGRETGPDLIIFIFLPALIFESAFAIPLHAFRKIVGAAAVLAVPVLLAGTAATAALMVALTAGHWGWGWVAALVFGTLISATDPVAVVALLRELGAPKRLGLLIEGESLLNDGTAIVCFHVLVAVLAGQGELSAGHAVLDFLRVAGGGIAVGLGLAMAWSQWLARTYNAPLVEITLTVALAYTAMVVAEAVLHVSGVMAIVAAGLWMSGPGRVHITPAVTHFLHRFWEMLSYLANTLIFFLVGLIIASQLGAATWADAAVVLAAFAGLVGLRFGLLFAFRPLINRVAEPVSAGETVVMAWGGLRGAVSLALALIVSRHPAIDPALGRQILLATAGVVLLTIVVNGGTMGRLLHRLGFDQPPPGELLAGLQADRAVLATVGERIAEVSRTRGLRTVDWAAVRADLSARDAELAAATEAAQQALAAAPPGERERGAWRQALRIERGAYWGAFAEGTLGAQATQILDHEVDLALDRLARPGSPADRRGARRGGTAAVTASVERDPDAGTPGWWGRLVAWWRRGGTAFGKVRFEAAARRYELCRGEALAAERVLATLGDLGDVDAATAETLRAAYRRMRHRAIERLEDLRANLPEVTNAIETRLARRVQLNFERDRYRALAAEGALNADATEAALASIDERLARLDAQPRRRPLPTVADLCRSLPIFAAVSPSLRERLVGTVRERTCSPGDLIVRQGDAGDSLFVVARGTVAVIEERDGEPAVLDLVGRGGLLGEMALLTGEPRSATLRAVTTATLGEMPRAAFDELMAAEPAARHAVQSAFAGHRFDNLLRGLPELRHLSHADRTAWFEQGTVRELAAGDPVPSEDAGYCFVAIGAIAGGGGSFGAPALVAAAPAGECRAVRPCVVVTLPARPAL